VGARGLTKFRLKSGTVSSCPPLSLRTVTSRRAPTRLAEQEAAAATDLEQVLRRLEREGVQDRAPRKGVHILGAVDEAGARPARTKQLDQPTRQLRQWTSSTGSPAISLRTQSTNFSPLTVTL
jgi:hypothetical protein